MAWRLTSTSCAVRRQLAGSVKVLPHGLNSFAKVHNLTPKIHHLISCRNNQMAQFQGSKIHRSENPCEDKSEPALKKSLDTDQVNHDMLIGEQNIPELMEV
jgi:hypothetical protein